MRLEGTGVALVTPFRGEAVDFDALRRLVDHVIDGGADFIVSLGTTGEAVTQTPHECRAVIDCTLEQVNGRVPVVAGMFGGNNTEALVRRFRDFDFDGLAAVMSSAPSYLRPSQQGLYEHYLRVAEASHLPIIIYNVPARTGVDVHPETVLRLAEADPKFVAVKEAAGSVPRVMTLAKHAPGHFSILAGDDLLTLPMIASGAAGAISVIANAFPRAFAKMVAAARQGQLAEARRWNHAMLEVHPLLYEEGNPAGIKAVLEAMGLCTRTVRLPLVAASDGLVARLRQAIMAEPLLRDALIQPA